MAGQLIIQVSPVDVQATPGGSPSTVRVDVFNSGRIVDQFWAGFVEAPDWLSGPPAMVSLFPDQRGSIELTVGIDAGKVVAAGAYPLVLRVVSASTRQVVHDQPIQLRVTPVFGATAIRLEPMEVFGVRTATLQVEVSQGGNAPGEVSLSADDPGGLLAFGFNPARLALPPSGSARATCTIWSRPPYFGDVAEYRFTVHAVGLQQPLEASGVFRQSPVFSRRRVRIIALTLTVLGAMVAILAALTLAWNKPGSVGLYSDSLKAFQWDWQHLIQSFWSQAKGDLVDVDSGLLKTRWLSGGSIVIALAVVSVFGALFGKKRIAQIASGLIVLAVVALLISQVFSAGEVGAFASGVFVALTGGVIAFAGSLFVRPLGRDIRIPKAPRAPRLPQAPKVPRAPTLR